MKSIGRENRSVRHFSGNKSLIRVLLILSVVVALKAAYSRSSVGEAWRATWGVDVLLFFNRLLGSRRDRYSGMSCCMERSHTRERRGLYVDWHGKSSGHERNFLRLFDVFSLFKLVNLFTYFSVRVGVSLLLLHINRA